jgi:hypothetical protein
MSVFPYFMKELKANLTKETIEENLKNFYYGSSLYDVLISLMGIKQNKNQFINNLNDVFLIAEIYYIGSGALADAVEDIIKVIRENQKATNVKYLASFLHTWTEKRNTLNTLRTMMTEKDNIYRVAVMLMTCSRLTLTQLYYAEISEGVRANVIIVNGCFTDPITLIIFSREEFLKRLTDFRKQFPSCWVDDVEPKLIAEINNAFPWIEISKNAVKRLIGLHARINAPKHIAFYDVKERRDQRLIITADDVRQMRELFR